VTANFALFLVSVAGISLSGVMIPGPLTAATVAKGFNDKNAGLMIGLGHGLVELPIIMLIYFGFASFITAPGVEKIIGVIGGIFLIFMGYMIMRSLGIKLGQAADLPANALLTGVVMTGANPYFYLWWATIGMALVATTAQFGIAGLLVFIVVHWLCDIGWEQFVSLTVYRTRHLWTSNARHVVFIVCAIILMGFGAWFCISVFV
jgi:threonine/homoserine/homoserine lactone efflux protein